MNRIGFKAGGLGSFFFLSFESGMDQIGLHRSKGVGQLQRKSVSRIDPALEEGSAVSFVSVFHNPQGKRKQLPLNLSSFFFLSLRKQIHLSLGKRIYHFLCRLLLHLRRKSTGSTYEPAGNSTAVSWSIPLLTVCSPCI